MPATTPAGPMRHDKTVLTVASAPVRAYRAGAGPALVLLHGGEHDRLVPPGDVRAAATRIPRARFMLVADAGTGCPATPPGRSSAS